MMVIINVAVPTGQKGKDLHVNAVKPEPAGVILTFSAQTFCCLLLLEFFVFFYSCKNAQISGATEINGSFNLILAAQV